MERERYGSSNIYCRGAACGKEGGSGKGGCTGREGQEEEVARGESAPCYSALLIIRTGNSGPERVAPSVLNPSHAYSHLSSLPRTPYVQAALMKEQPLIYNKEDLLNPFFVVFGQRKPEATPSK